MENVRGVLLYNIYIRLSLEARGLMVVVVVAVAVVMEVQEVAEWDGDTVSVIYI